MGSEDFSHLRLLATFDFLKFLALCCATICFCIKEESLDTPQYPNGINTQTKKQRAVAKGFFFSPIPPTRYDINRGKYEMRSYCLSVEDNSLAIREDANGTRWQVVCLTPETNSCWHPTVGVGQKCSTDIGSRLFIELSLHGRIIA